MECDRVISARVVRHTGCPPYDADVTVDVAARRPVTVSLRRLWVIGTIAVTAGSLALGVALAPPAGTSPMRGLTWLLFVGSSVHVAATGWFFTVPEVRAHARRQPRRYVVAPIALVALTALLAAVVTPHGFAWALLGFFAWQFFHFQKQNVGMAALACASHRVRGLSHAERSSIVAAGVGGIIGLLAHPELLRLSVAPPVRWAYALGAAVFIVAVIAGVLMLRRRDHSERPAAFVAIYLLSLGFFAPVFMFSSPYAALTGVVLAHGFQYLLIVGLVAGGQRRLSPVLQLGVLLNVALFGGIALNLASHLHDGSWPARAAYGAYLGLVMTHFVVDAGLWRMRDEFPRSFLQSDVPYLLGRCPRRAPAAAS